MGRTNSTTSGGNEDLSRTSYISVKNLSKSLEKAIGLGAKTQVLTATIDGFRRFAVIKDPGGADVVL